MTDERIKEERNKTAKIIVARLLGSLEATPLNISMIETLLVEYEIKITCTAERLAKIEAAEEARKRAATRYGIGVVLSELDDMIAELKEANR